MSAGDAQNFVNGCLRRSAEISPAEQAEWDTPRVQRVVVLVGSALVKGTQLDDCGDAPLRKTLPAQSFRPNGFGLFDVAGNAAEWVEDCWNDNYRGAPANGTAWTTGQCQQRSLRGGSFSSKASFVRSAARFRYDQDVRYYANGFRVARDF